MKIGIISDTHISKHPEKIITMINEYFPDIDHIIHCGDFKTGKVASLLKQRGDFTGVVGNVDEKLVSEILNEKEILKLGGYRIGVYHGHGKEKTTMERAYDKFKDDKVDIIIFGHSHMPLVMTKGKILMINPGSPTYKRKDRWFSYVVLELLKDKVNVELKLFTH